MVQDLMATVATAPAGTYKIDQAAAEAPLANAGLSTLAEAVKSRATADNLVLPDMDDLIERAIVGLLAGNLVLHGPPGTGKTHLARLLADVFGCTLAETTGTPEWSTYDVVGGLRPAVGPRGAEILQPWLGSVTQAALDCGRVTNEHLSSQTGPQAHWLLIDELSRADIDKAIGPLYTALSGGKAADRVVNLWFETSPDRTSVVLPERFRIVATMNDVDTAFVNQLSQGLQRRFKFVFVGVPDESQTGDELSAVARQAAAWYGKTYAQPEPGDLSDYANQFTAEPHVTQVLARLRELVLFLRWDSEGPRWPVGSAQLASVLQQVAIRAYADPGGTDLEAALDSAVADQLVKQASALSEDEFEPMANWLSRPGFERAARALEQLRTPYRTIGT